MEWLHVEGNKLLNQSGQVIRLYEANVENREWAGGTINYERRAIPVLTGAPPEGWGANVVTLAFASGPVLRRETAYLSALDELISLAKTDGAYTHLVYRYSEPNDEQPAGPPDDAAETALALLAGRYANRPAVLYGLKVEAFDVDWPVLRARFISDSFLW